MRSLNNLACKAVAKKLATDKPSLKEVIENLEDYSVNENCLELREFYQVLLDSFFKDDIHMRSLLWRRHDIEPQELQKFFKLFTDGLTYDYGIIWNYGDDIVSEGPLPYNILLASEIDPDIEFIVRFPIEALLPKNTQGYILAILVHNGAMSAVPINYFDLKDVIIYKNGLDNILIEIIANYSSESIFQVLSDNLDIKTTKTLFGNKQITIEIMKNEIVKMFNKYSHGGDMDVVDANGTNAIIELQLYQIQFP